MSSVITHASKSTAGYSKTLRSLYEAGKQTSQFPQEER